ncbi:unnamed protein product, partial [marine sediment metagenome]
RKQNRWVEVLNEREVKLAPEILTQMAEHTVVPGVLEVGSELDEATIEEL